MTKVVHCKKERFDIYIGRPSVFGNPFQIGKDGTREEVIEKFKQWINGVGYKDVEPNRRKSISPNVKFLKDKVLG
jgi:hypothetical protein